MIEVGFAIFLGFAITSLICGVMEEGSRLSQIFLRGVIYLTLLSMIWLMLRGEPVEVRPSILNLVIGGIFDQTAWFFSGGIFAIFFHLFAKGYLYEFWIRFHPQSAPTPEAHIGQRARVAGFRRERTPATLVGTSTAFLSTDLDLRTETLIRLCYSTFEDRGPLMMSRLEAELRLGTGRRQRAFHKIVAGNKGRPKTKRIVHRYWRSVNGSSRLSQGLFGDLCMLARQTDNRDRATIDRLSRVGNSLGLTAEEMGRAIRSAL